MIFASGTLGGKFAQKATGTGDWDEAHRITEAYEKAGSWTGERPREPDSPEPGPATTVSKPRITVEEACKVLVTNREAAGLAPATLRKYRTLTKQITAYADSLGYVMIDQFTPGDIDLFWANWKLGPRAKGKRLTTLRAFFRFCVNRKWIPDSPVSADIKAPVGSSKAKEKAPFTDEELHRIIEACDGVKVEWKNDGRAVRRGVLLDCVAAVLWRADTRSNGTISHSHALRFGSMRLFRVRRSLSIVCGVIAQKYQSLKGLRSVASSVYGRAGCGHDASRPVVVSIAECGGVKGNAAESLHLPPAPATTHDQKVRLARSVSRRTQRLQERGTCVVTALPVNPG